MSRRFRSPRLLQTTPGKIGCAILLFALVTALLGPIVAPRGITTVVAVPGAPPSPSLPLGADYLGRDVLSRLLHGGLSVIWIGGAATLLAYLVGATVGLVAGYRRSLVDPLLMRSVDVLIAFPALLVLLLLVAGLGSQIWVLVVGVALVQVPPISRIVRAATLEASTHGYVEAAEGRGESTPQILLREVLPNVAPVVLADFGIRFGFSIILIASVNYLGLGLNPPAADWGLMIAENQQYISLNVWSVLAPAIMLALLTIGVNLIADTYIQTLGRSSIAARPRRSLRSSRPPGLAERVPASAPGEPPGTIDNNEGGH